MADLVAHTALAGRSFMAGSIGMVAGLADAADARFARIMVSGTGTLDLLAISGMAHSANGSLTTRLAALRVAIDWQRTPTETARISVDRFSADYLWEWLAAKARIEAGVDISS